MDITSVGGVSPISPIDKLNAIYNTNKSGKVTETNDLLNINGTDSKANRNATFESLFQSALSMVKETNEYSNQAKEAEMGYAMGTMTSTHDLQIAQQKANISLQYTVAVRNAVLDAYREIMQLQF